MQNIVLTFLSDVRSEVFRGSRSGVSNQQEKQVGAEEVIGSPSLHPLMLSSHPPLALVLPPPSPSSLSQSISCLINDFSLFYIAYNEVFYSPKKLCRSIKLSLRVPFLVLSVSLVAFLHPCQQRLLAKSLKFTANKFVFSNWTKAKFPQYLNFIQPTS